MQLSDTHAHLYLPEFDDDRHLVIKRARKAGVERIYLPNIDRGTLPGLRRLCKAYPSTCFPMAGLHPGSVKADYREELRFVEATLSTGGYCGIGEIGIDLYWDNRYKKEQIAAFTRQLELAVSYRLPAIIHVRNAFEEVFTVLDELNCPGLRGIFHCFSGNEEQAEKALSYGGFKLGIGGVLTFKKNLLASVVAGTGLKDMVLETDAPYLTPAPFRGKRNESAYVLHVAEKMAEIKSIGLQEVAEATTAATAEVFGF
ncbi:MAG: TatD family hydrolase [Flavobacteriales bacterium]